MDERINRVVEHPMVVPIASAAAAFVVGAATGYIFGKRKRAIVVPAEKVWDCELTSDSNPQTVFVDEDGEEISKRDVALPLEPGISWHDNPNHIVTIGEPEAIKLSDERPRGVVIDEEVFTERVRDIVSKKEKPVRTNVFARGDDSTWNYEEELSKRSTETPYILHKDEFYEDALNYTQVTYTYFAGDDILVDEEEAPVYDHTSKVGELRFGHGSGDPHVVYVRNDKFQTEYEILFDPGLYSVEVQGLEIENNERVKYLKHSAEPRFRMD